MSAATPRIWVAAWTGRAYVDDAAAGDGHIWLDTPAWFAWLDGATRFAYPLFDPEKGYMVGVMTARKERRARGGLYWTAYRRADGHLRKVYLGRAQAVTQARLAAVAEDLRGRDGADGATVV